MSGLVLLVLSLSWAARSEAAVICVPSPASGCDQSFGELQDALDAAAASPERDHVKIAAGTYVGPASGPGGFTYGASGAVNQVEIEGSGIDATTIRLGNTTGAQTGLSVNSQAGASISGLGVEIPPNEDDGDTGIAIIGPGTGTSVQVSGTEASQTTGISCTHCSLSRARVVLPTAAGSANTGIEVPGEALVEKSLVRAHTGIRNTGTEVASIFGTRIQAARGVASEGGGIGLQASLLLLEGPDAVGLDLADGQLDEGGTAGAALDGVSLVGSPSGTSTGIAVVSHDGKAADLFVKNTVISGTAHAVSLTADGGHVSSEFEYSALDESTNQLTELGGGTISYKRGAGYTGDLLDPGFSDGEVGDFTPGPNSPLIDAGDPADPYSVPGSPNSSPPWESTEDLLGRRRACQGRVGAPIRRDIGAIEYKVDFADDCHAPSTQIVSAPGPTTTETTPAFEVGSDEAPVHFLCRWDFGEQVQCGGNRFQAPDLGTGPHSVTIKAVDQFGNVDPLGQSRTYRVVRNRDRTRPAVLGVRLPRKTRRARVKVRFRSNEGGVTFTCRLNHRRAKRCKSQWKTPRLRKGRNVVRIQATDRAGNRSKVVRRVVKRVAKRKARHR